MDDFVIETTNLTRRYGRQLTVDRVDLRVPRGGIFGFLGPNGAGKTTTIRMLLGLIRPTAGRIRIFGREMPRERLAILRRTGSLVESPSYYGHLSGRENLQVWARLVDVQQSRIDEVLEMIRLAPAAAKAVQGYSLGMKQRLGLATALLGEPELLLLDEPTNGLDPAGIHEIRGLIRALPALHGTTVVVSSHLLGEIDQLATHVGVIDHGRLLFQDTIERLRARSAPRLVVHVDRPTEAAKVLGDAGWQVSRHGDALELPPSVAAPDVGRRLVGAGIAVLRLSRERPSLEEVFLGLVDGRGSL